MCQLMQNILCLKSICDAIQCEWVAQSNERVKIR